MQGTQGTQGLQGGGFNQAQGTQGTQGIQGVSSYYQVVSSNGTQATQRSTLNFVGATVTDDNANNRTTVTITAGGGLDINAIMGVY